MSHYVALYTDGRFIYAIIAPWAPTQVLVSLELDRGVMQAKHHQHGHHMPAERERFAHTCQPDW